MNLHRHHLHQHRLLILHHLYHHHHHQYHLDHHGHLRYPHHHLHQNLNLHNHHLQIIVFFWYKDLHPSLTHQYYWYKHFTPFKLPYSIINVIQFNPRLTIVISTHQIKVLTMVEAVAYLMNSYIKLECCTQLTKSKDQREAQNYSCRNYFMIIAQLITNFAFYIDFKVFAFFKFIQLFF